MAYYIMDMLNRNTAISHNNYYPFHIILCFSSSFSFMPSKLQYSNESLHIV